MAKLPSVRRLIAADFPQALYSLVNRLNTFMTEVVSSLSTLTVVDNMAGDIREIEVTGSYPLYLAWNKVLPPAVVIVGKVKKIDGAAVGLVDAVQVDWSLDSSNRIKVNSVVGISPTPANKYKLTLLILS